MKRKVILFTCAAVWMIAAGAVGVHLGRSAASPADYAACIATIVRVGKVNTEYRRKLESAHLKP